MRTILTFIIAFAAVPQARSAVVVYDNTSLTTPTFVWVASNLLSTGSSFDPTRSPEDQAGVTTPPAMGYSGHSTLGAPGSLAINGFNCSTGLNVIRDATGIPIDTPRGPATLFPATVFRVGDTIGPGANYRQNADAAFTGDFLGGNVFRLLGQSPVVGFRATLADGIHYGWIEFNWTTGPRSDGSVILMYQPLRWGYETLPNVPITIAIPTPAGIAPLVAFGLFASRRRRGAP